MNKVLKFCLIWALFTIIFSGLIFAWLLNTRSAIFGTNDDELISSILNASYGKNFQKNLIFIQPILSYPLAFLQNLFTNVNVYSIFLVEIVIISYSAIFTSILRFGDKITKAIIILIFIIYAISFITWFSINPTYTGSSLYCVGASAYFFILAIIDNKENSILNIFLMSLFFLLGYFIRKESLFIFLLISIPLTVLYLFKKKYQNINLKTLLISGSLITFIITFNFFLFKNSYRGMDWQNYIQMNDARHKIQLRAPERNLYLHLTDVNWSNYDYQLFQRFALLDQSTMNKNSMNKILEVTRNYVGVKSVFSTPILPTLKSFITAFQPWTWILKLILFNIALFSFILVVTKSSLIFFLREISLLIIPISIGLVIISSGYQLPERITLNILASSVPLLFLIFYNNLKNIPITKLFSIFLITFTATICFIYFNRFTVELKARQDFYKSRMSYSNQQRDSLSKINEDVVLLGSSSVFKSDWRFPFTKYEDFDSKSRIITLGWHNLSPLWLQKTYSKNINGTNFPDEYFNSKLFYVENSEEILVLQKYLQNKKYEFNLIETRNFGPADFFLYKFNLN